ncbi:MAG TPA: STN domain-containing protein, partial [Gemmatimonadaceae bacterium]
MAAAVVSIASAASAAASVASGASDMAQRATSGPLDRPAHLDVENIWLSTALRELADHARIALVYSPSLVPDLAVTCRCGASTTREALATLLDKTNLTFRESGGQVMLVPAPAAPGALTLATPPTPADDTSSPSPSQAASVEVAAPRVSLIA